MESSRQISADLQSVLLEKHLNFELLNTYKGVPFICKAILEEVEAEVARFSLSPASPFAWETVKYTLILSEGLLEPIEARLVSFDREAGKIWVNNFAYAGSKLSNRKELRVMPEGDVEVFLETNGQHVAVSLADLSMRGAGLWIAEELFKAYGQGKQLNLLLRLPEGEVRLIGRARNITKASGSARLAVEFLEAKPDKTPIVRYLMRRRAEIMAEMKRLSTGM